MRRYCQPFHLAVLAWDWEPKPEADVSVMTRAAFYRAHPEYENIPGPPRLTINLIDTARWRVMADLLDADLGPVTYIDGDQWFFSSPEPLFEEIGGARLAVSPHRIPPRAMGLPGVVLETHRKYALFNSGFSYVADVAIAEEMARSVYRWSYSGTIEHPPGVYYFGDQGWLEQVAVREGAHVIQHPGVNVAPWNANRHRIYVKGGSLYVGDDWPLVTYHFSGLRFEGGKVTHLVHPEYCVPQAYLDLVYKPYVWQLEGKAQNE
jgi:hypothetical protein